MKTRLIAPAIMLALLAAGCSSGDSAEAAPSAPATTQAAPTAETVETLTVAGGVVLPFGGFEALELAKGESACRSAGPDYSAIDAGVQVQVLDASGAIVGTGKLGNGAVLKSTADSTLSVGCSWAFTIEVDAGGRFYTAKVLDWATDAIAESDVASTPFLISPTS